MEPLFTKKHYEFFQDYFIDNDGLGINLENFCEIFKEDNPKFDQKKFLDKII